MEDSIVELHPKVLLKRIEIFTCKRCPLGFTNYEDLMKHVLVHAKLAYVKLVRKQIYKCKQCPAAFLKKDICKIHEVYHVYKNVKNKHSLLIDNHNSFYSSNIERKFKCSECGRMFVHESTLKEHNILHEPFPHICYCGIGFYLEKDLLGHKKIVHNEIVETKPLNGKIKYKPKSKVIYKDDSFDETSGDNSCDETKIDLYQPKIKVTTKHKRNIKRSIVREPRSKVTTKTVTVYKECPICKKKIKGYLKTHLETHSVENKYKCPMCNKSFKTNAVYRNHITYVHKPPQFKCHYCIKCFSTKGNLELHIRTHTGEKPYTCSYCQKPFGDPSALGRHIRTHTNEMKYFCDICPKAYTDKSGLIGHKLRKHFKMEYKCDICEQRLNTQQSLNLHILLHANKKKYECHDCGSKFNLKSYLVNHWNRTHGRHRKIKKNKKVNDVKTHNGKENHNLNS